jgi:hypothetical protein
MKNVSHKYCRKNKTQLISKKLAVYEIMWKNNVELGRPQMKVRCTSIAFWISKATNTHSEYVILIDYPLQQ